MQKGSQGHDWHDSCVKILCKKKASYFINGCTSNRQGVKMVTAPAVKTTTNHVTDLHSTTLLNEGQLQQQRHRKKTITSSGEPIIWYLLNNRSDCGRCSHIGTPESHAAFVQLIICSWAFQSGAFCLRAICAYVEERAEKRAKKSRKQPIVFAVAASSSWSSSVVSQSSLFLHFIHNSFLFFYSSVSAVLYSDFTLGWHRQTNSQFRLEN